ncbi:hypothetical protein BSZ39_01560 [Bowdeniella nasicola]|uniref:Peptidase S9 prolyl oligopeptidase catalytic domain-containing protein n=1 Tax=Bowdeniella nasicola TaxID=208480 RepID=A0A1Q5Q4Z5_9ACTO|nr:prolyl oligopeptidase family serine peptidase [Bowdeniella nasicola]OKL54894.1 hypothetical protein BSZ39_01560 [Bowdeniella nasicola]
MTTTTMPYGAWPSILSLEALTASKTTLGDPLLTETGLVTTKTGSDGITRLAVERDGHLIEIPLHDETGKEISIGSRVHEYGGPALAIEGSDVIVSNRDDGRLYRAPLAAEPGASASPITPDDGWRYCDISAVDGHVIAVAEIYDNSRADGYPRHAIVDIDCADLERTVLYDGADFIAGVRLSPSRERITWFEWELGQMPWDDTRIMLGERFETSIKEITRIDSGTSAAVFPMFVTDDDLLFIDDLSGWWNIYRAELGPQVRLRTVHPAEAEFADPAWVMQSPYTVLDEEHVLVKWRADGQGHIGSLAWRTGELEEWLIGYDPLGTPACLDDRVAILAGSATQSPVVLNIDLPHARTRVVATSEKDALPEEWISLPEPISWETPEVDGLPAHEAYGYFYSPHHPEVTAPEGEKPPLIVMVHGGPTSSTWPVLRDGIQFWTTRGFAVLDVDYAGSSGYGRAYRDLLVGQWGVIDNADIAAGVRFLADSGLIDQNRAVIRGGSAGGYAVLRALSTSDVFAAGTSLYGVADLELLAKETHIFEARYLDGLIGAYPEDRDTYRDRSPIHHLDAITAPVLLLQGEDDKVVPPSQATVIHDALHAAGQRVALRMYPGEAHGFRTADVKKDAAATELAFYGDVLGFKPHGIEAAVPWS